MPRPLILLLPLALACLAAEAATVNVNCNRGQTIGAALAALDRHGPNTVNVRGTCTETVDVAHFEQLTLRGRGGAVLAAPDDGGTEPARGPLQIRGSRSVTVRGFTIVGRSEAVLMLGCVDCRLQDNTIEGVTLVSGLSQVLLVRNVLRANGMWAAFAIYDNSIAHLAGCSVEPGTGALWWGIQADDGPVVKIVGTTVRGFPIGIGLAKGTLVQLWDFAVEGVVIADPTVLIEDSWYAGIAVNDNATLQAGSVTRVRNSGSGGLTGGVLAEGGSVVSLEGGAEVAGSNGVGVLVSDGSQARLTGSARITGTSGNGLVVANNSSATATGPAEITGSSAQDVFCDATGVVSGGGLLVGTPKVTCPNLNAGRTVALPVP